MFFLRCCVKEHIDGTELTDAEKAYTKKMCGLSDSKTQLNDRFFLNMNDDQIKYLLSIVDMQDAQYSVTYQIYIKRLHSLAKLKKIEITSPKY